MKKILIILLTVSVVGNVALSLCLRESRYEVQQTTIAAVQPLQTTNQFGGDLSVQRISEFIYAAHRLSQQLNATVSVSYPLKGEQRKVDFTPNGAILK